MESVKTMETIVKTLSERKAQDIEVLDIREVSIMADYFVICTGTSTTQIKALADEVDQKLSALGVEPLHKEGYGSATWILLDYGDVILHVFHKESRAFYSLEQLWADSAKVDLTALISE